MEETKITKVTKSEVKKEESQKIVDMVMEKILKIK